MYKLFHWQSVSCFIFPWMVTAFSRMMALPRLLYLNLIHCLVIHWLEFCYHFLSFVIGSMLWNALEWYYSSRILAYTVYAIFLEPSSLQSSQILPTCELMAPSDLFSQYTSAPALTRVGSVYCTVLFNSAQFISEWPEPLLSWFQSMLKFWELTSSHFLL